MNRQTASRRAIFHGFFGAFLFFFSIVSCGEAQESGKSPIAAGEPEAKKPARIASRTIAAEQVPEAVKQAFLARFPAVKATEWKEKADKIYEAEFTLKGTEITAMFDSTGKWLETESAIDPAKVPKVVSAAAATQFKGYKVIETQSVQRWDEQHLIYELHFENAKDLAKAQFSSEGVILSQSTKAKP